jgi:hypothetical protein
MTKERVNELKLQYQKELEYYEKLGFEVLQGKFRTVLEILAEIEEVIKVNEELTARLQAKEEEAKAKLIEAAAAREGRED